MVTQANTVAFQGIQAVSVEAQVHFSSGLAAFQVVGLPDGAVRESRERVRGALHAMGFDIPAKRVIVNLAPADILKEGSHFDLPIAVALLATMGVIPPKALAGAFFMGELGLDGSLKPVSGALSAAIQANAAGAERFFLPAANASEAAWSGMGGVFGLKNLRDFMAHAKGQTVLMPASCAGFAASTLAPSAKLDFADVRGQESAKRAAEIAAAGAHNLLMVGPPGSGKSMIAARMPGILPPLSPEEALEVSMIHSVAGMLGEAGLVTARPFRDPHHTASSAALCGGGPKAKPGEVSLAHRGVLFLDELPEFPRPVLETLRQPLEGGTITVSRANHHFTYPAKFQLIAAMNPCPCGYVGHPAIACKDSPLQVQNYQNRLSGPLLDRIDMHITVNAVEVKDLSLPPAKETSADIAARVLAARAKQAERFALFAQSLGEAEAPRTNAELTVRQLDDVAAPDAEGAALLQKASEKFHLSARAYHRVLRVARTLADLEGEEAVRYAHVAEALAYRRREAV